MTVAIRDVETAIEYRRVLTYPGAIDYIVREWDLTDFGNYLIQPLGDQDALWRYAWVLHQGRIVAEIVDPELAPPQPSLPAAQPGPLTEGWLED